MPEEPKKYICEQCNYETNLKTSFDKHLLSKKHINFDASKKFKYSCEQCNFSTDLRQSYDRHLESKMHLNAGIRIKCEQCKPKKVYDYICPHCDYITNASTTLRYHILKKHMTIEEQSKNFPHWCDCCQIGYICKKQFQAHISSQRHQNNMMYYERRQKHISVDEIMNLIEHHENKDSMIVDLSNKIQKQFHAQEMISCN